MSNDENSGITEEQRARISRNFRAASAILARKRSRLHSPDACSSASIDCSSHALPCRVKSSDGGGKQIHTIVSNRIPLREIPCNVTSAAFQDHPNTNVLDYFEDPINLPESSALNNSSPSILDVDFDASVLEEIDALCEPKSYVKIEGQDLNSNMHVVSQYSCSSANGVGLDINSTIDGEFTETVGELHSGDEKQSREEGTNSLTLDMKTMPQDYATYLLSLNERQREAACSDISVPLVIVAGPGSGKTSTMVGRVLMLLNEGICPANILAMTFTTAAASEMRERIGVVAGKAHAKELTISTFHSFSLHLCRSHAEKLGRSSEFLIYGHGQQRRAVIEALRLLEHGKCQQKIDAHMPSEVSNNVISPQFYKDKSKKWLKFVSKAKACGKTPTDCRQMGDEIGAVILENYDDILKSCDALDYHDLISCSVKLLSDYSEVSNECKNSWKAIVVDEFQDTSSMQYNLLRLLASHNHVTIVGDDDQSIFSFNGADVSGFYSFKEDFPNYKEVRLHKNYRSTRNIVEAASSLINNNTRRCQLKIVQTDNSLGSKKVNHILKTCFSEWKTSIFGGKSIFRSSEIHVSTVENTIYAADTCLPLRQITIKECHNEESQCAFVVDKILELASNGTAPKCFGKMAILYRRQISGKIFQTSLRERKIPFNLHGVAFYRKKVVRAIIAMLRTAVPGCDDGQYHRVFKALLPLEKDEKKRVISHIEKVSTIRQCSFMEAACDIFNAKISGTLKRNHLSQGRKVLSTVEMISKLVDREQSISAVITSVSNMVPQRYLLDQRAVVNVDGRKLLNEDNDVRTVLQYLLDDVSDFFSSYYTVTDGEKESLANEKGCHRVLKAFIDHISNRERENFHSRRCDNQSSVSLTTIHQSKGLEWDVVFIVKANECEIPLLHECNGFAEESGSSVEEERRLFYVAMTRAREKLFILYTLMDSNWQMVQPSRFLTEIPSHFCEIQAELSIRCFQSKDHGIPKEHSDGDINLCKKLHSSEVETVQIDSLNIRIREDSEELKELMETSNGNRFLRRFSVENRSIISHLFHQWAKKQAFQDPSRLLDKVGFVIDERLRVKKTKNKEMLHALKSSLSCAEAFQYAEYVLRWEKMPADRRALLMQEKQEHFQKSRIESAMGSSATTAKQISYLRNLGCTITPNSRLHASKLIEQYKSL